LAQGWRTRPQIGFVLLLSPGMAHFGVAAFLPGERIQVFSCSTGQWFDGRVEEVARVSCVINGGAIPVGAVRVSYPIGGKWIMPEQFAAMLRKPSDSPVAAPPSPAIAARRPSRSPTMKKCKNYEHGCNRLVQPGLTRGLQPYEHCCKKCAVSGGRGGHDENCGGHEARGSTAGDGASGRAAAPVSTGNAKVLLHALLRNPDALQRNVVEVLMRQGCDRNLLNKPHVALALKSLCAQLDPTGADEELQNQVREPALTDMVRQFDSNGDGILVEAEFVSLCRNLLVDRERRWFPEKLTVSAQRFARRNERPIEEVYMLGRKVGEGSFGVVYFAEHRISGEKRVVKRIRTDRPDLDMSLTLREIQNMAMLDHPNVIKVYEYFHDRKYISQIIEPCNGGDLKEKIDGVFRKGEKMYHETFICDVIKQIMRALAFMHSIHFAHKDLKPENIMFVDKVSSSIKVIDFGLAELFNPHSRQAEFIAGTLLFMPPEVFLHNTMTTKSDVWSAGVVLYNMITGSYPYMGQWPPLPGHNWQKETSDMIATAPMAPHTRLNVVSNGCVEVMSMMLTKDMHSRPEAAHCLKHRWLQGRSEAAPTLSVGVIQCIGAFCRMSELKQAIFFLIAYQSAVPALEDLRSIFTHFDEGNQGRLNMGSMALILAEAGFAPLEAEGVIHALDRDSSGNIEWTEFVAAALCVSVCRNTRLVDAAFATIDQDQDGHITAADLDNVLGDGSRIWKERMPVLFEEMRSEPSGTAACLGGGGLAKMLTQILPGRAGLPSITRNQFRAFMGQGIRCKTGDKLFSVS